MPDEMVRVVQLPLTLREFHALMSFANLGAAIAAGLASNTATVDERLIENSVRTVLEHCDEWNRVTERCGKLAASAFPELVQSHQHFVIPRNDG